MEMINKKDVEIIANIKDKSFIYRIHPSVKIILFLFIFKIIFSFNFDFGVEFKFTLQKQIFYFLYFLFFIFIFLFLSNVVPNFGRKCIRQIWNFRFFLFFHLWLNMKSFNNTGPNNDLSFYMFNMDTTLFIIIFVFLYFISFFFIQNKYKKFYVFIMFLLMFCVPSILVVLFPDKSNDFAHFYVEKKVFFNIFLIFFRICIFFMLNLLIIQTTSFIEINDGLEIILKPLKILKFPIEVFSLMMSLIFMSIPFLIEESQKILKAQLSRGLNFYTKNIIKKVYYLISLLIPIFILVFKKSFTLANAMETRGYVLGNKRTKLNIYKITRIDYLVFISVLSFFLLSFHI
ncbi:energy-coupling factor transporter transmembrane component T [Candidatus Phytoplasma fraxini]|uniref:Energy-coupling factor transporter transmembrane component EcfT n=1 Tax=Ash yellows phytoplasma TaxID=35780 RepID=A0ABZ2U832_ASHYP